MGDPLPHPSADAGAWQAPQHAASQQLLLPCHALTHLGVAEKGPGAVGNCPVGEEEGWCLGRGIWWARAVSERRGAGWGRS